MKHIVAVYGSLRQGFGNHRIINQRPLSTEVLHVPFYMISLGAFPALIPCPYKTPITVEVYEVDDATFSRLDMLEGYPDFYNRSEVSTTQGPAWLYHFDNEGTHYSNGAVDGGDWDKYVRSMEGA